MQFDAKDQQRFAIDIVAMHKTRSLLQILLIQLAVLKVIGAVRPTPYACLPQFVKRCFHVQIVLFQKTLQPHMIVAYAIDIDYVKWNCKLELRRQQIIRILRLISSILISYC